MNEQVDINSSVHDLDVLLGPNSGAIR
jgi:hypothetical protein